MTDNKTRNNTRTILLITLINSLYLHTNKQLQIFGFTENTEEIILEDPHYTNRETSYYSIKVLNFISFLRFFDGKDSTEHRYGITH